MFQVIDIEKPIQVRTGDYRHKWVDARITSVKMEQVSNDEDENPIYGLSFGVTFIMGEDEGLIQWVSDAFGWSKDEWRYKESVEGGEQNEAQNKS